MVVNGAEAKRVEEQLARDGKRLPCNSYNPRCLVIGMSSMRHGVQRDHKLTDVLLWAVEIGRVDMSLETYTLSTHPALPHIRHLEQVMHIFGYLKAHPKTQVGV